MDDSVNDTPKAYEDDAKMAPRHPTRFDALAEAARVLHRAESSSDYDEQILLMGIAGQWVAIADKA